MGVLKYSKRLVFPNVAHGSAGDILASLRGIFATKRVGDLTQSGDRLLFKNLYLKRLDLLPIPQGWIQVTEANDGLHVTYAADYRWVNNGKGRLFAMIAAFIMVLVTFYKAVEIQQAVGTMPSPWIFLAIPVYVVLLWLFVFSLNSWYSRLYLARLISGLMQLNVRPPKLPT